MTVIARRRVLCFTRSHLSLISSLHWHSTLAPLCNSLRKHQTPLKNFPRSSRDRCKDLAALVGSASGLALYCQRPWSAPEPHPAVVDVASGCLVNTRRAGRDGLITTNLLDRLTLTLDFLYATWFNPECNPCEREIAGCSCRYKLEDGFECIYKYSIYIPKKLHVRKAGSDRKCAGTGQMLANGFVLSRYFQWNGMSKRHQKTPYTQLSRPTDMVSQVLETNCPATIQNG